MKAYESEHCGWLHEGLGVGEAMRATWREDGNPICRHFCADIVRLFISTPYEIETERKRAEKGGRRATKREREGRIRFIAVLAYCRGSAEILFRPFLPLPHATRTAVQPSTVHRIHAVATGLLCSPSSVRHESRRFPRDGQSRHCRRKFPTDAR